MRDESADWRLVTEHHDIKEPAILLGGAFMVDAVENAEENEEKKR